MLPLLDEKLSLPCMRSNVDNFAPEAIQKLLSIRDGIIGFERFITDKQNVSHIIYPSNHKTIFSSNVKELPIFISSSQENLHFYSVTLKNCDFLPVLLYNNSCLFDDLFLNNKDEQIFIQLLAKYKSGNWKQTMLQQYATYLRGIDFPTRTKVFQIIQVKALKLLDSVSSNSSGHDADEHIENKIVNDGYSCELRFAIRSADPENTIIYIKSLLKQYAYLNKFVVHEEDDLLQSMKNTTFTNNVFHLSDSEIISLVQSQKEYQSSPEQLDNLNTPQSKDIPISSCKDIQKALNIVGLIPPKYKINQTDELTGHNLKLISIKIPKNKTFTQFVKRTDDISAALGKDVSITKGKEPNTLTFLFPLKHRKPVYLNSLLNTDSFKQYASTHFLPIIVGLNMWDKPIYEDLAKSPHLLIAGATNSGKSVFLNCVITTLTKIKKRNELQFYIIDPKQVEFKDYNDHPYVKDVVIDMKKAVRLLIQLVGIMESRYSQLASANVKNIQEYNQLSSDPMPYIVCIIDEFADLIIQYKNSEYIVQRLGQKARAAGIHLILTTQYPNKDAINGTIKANFPSRISFQLSNNTEYRTVFGTGIPYKNLLGMGDGVMNWVSEQEQFIRFQAPLVADEKKVNNKDKLKKLIEQTGETRVKELQQKMGIRINLVSDLMKQLMEEGLLYKDSRGYQIVMEKDE